MDNRICSRPLCSNKIDFDGSASTVLQGEKLHEFVELGDKSITTSSGCDRYSKISNYFNVWLKDTNSSNDFCFCTDCTLMTNNILESMSTEAFNDNNRYMDFLNNINIEDHNYNETQLDLEIQQLIKQESTNKKLLDNLHNVCSSNIKELQKHNETIKLLNEEEEAFWEYFNLFQSKLSDFRKEQYTLSKCKSYCSSQLALIQEDPIIDLFNINTSLPIGEINNLRLGITSKIKVENEEINAALGTCVLFLYIAASSIKDFKFSAYEVIPCGSTSIIDDFTVKHELYISKSKSMVSLFSSFIFSNSTLDNSLAVFLKCLKELLDYVKKKDRHFLIPHVIENHKIGNTSIKKTEIKDDEWTESMKKVLHNMKNLLEWIKIQNNKE